MVRPQRRVLLASENLVRASAGAPGGRPQPKAEVPLARAGRQESVLWRARKRAATLSERCSHVLVSAERCLKGPSQSCHGEGNRQQSGPERLRDTRGAAGTFYSPLAVTQCDESSARSRLRDHECAERQGRREANYYAARPRTSRVGELLPNGHVLLGVSQDRLFCVIATGAFDVSACRTATDQVGPLNRRTVLGCGSISTARERRLPGASHTRTIIVKPRTL